MGKNYKLNFTDEISVHDILGMKKASSKPFSKKHKFDIETIVGERIGKDGKLAYIHQIIDRTKNYYKKFVKQGDLVIKDIEGKLTEHKRKQI